MLVGEQLKNARAELWDIEELFQTVVHQEIILANPADSNTDEIVYCQQWPGAPEVAGCLWAVWC